MSDFVLYGSTGYVGRAIAELAVARGLRPLLAGRNAQSVEEQASQLGLDHATVALDQTPAIDQLLGPARVVLNCAGPFFDTHRPIVESAIRVGTHYLDITGEPPVYESIASFDSAAVERGVMLLPGAGFDVVATDCLAVHLKQRLPSATHLTLAFHQDGPAGAPPGTLNTLIELFAHGSSQQHRVDGEIRRASGKRPTRLVDFGAGPVEAALMTWGDIFLAHRSTGIPNIEDYVVLLPGLDKQLNMSERIRPAFKLPFVRWLAKKTLRGGATAQEVAATQTRVWGEVRDDDGNRAISTLHGPEAGQVWTARAALRVVDHVLSGELTPGFQTPATVYGPGLTLEIDGVTRADAV